ncbi:MAG: two-component system NarL family sensor kinase, partial [Saprospiraceae bacterium]
GQEQERHRLAQEIHDGIGPMMSTIRLNLDAVKRDLGDIPEKTLNKVNAMGDLIQNIATDIRQISHDLMPSALIDFGITEALNSLSQKINQSEMLTVNFYHIGIKKRLERRVEVNLYRIVQELLNNAIKYAKAKTINIQLVQRDNMIVLTVEDDGIGFDQNKIDEFLENGIGLRNINTRVTSLNGLFSIDTQKGKGVMSTIEIPVIKKNL